MGSLLTTASVMMCPHGGTVNAISTNLQTKAAGAPILRASDTFLIIGCALSAASPPSPCVQVRWVQHALQPKAVGDFVLTSDSVGLCIAASQAVQGTVLIMMTQPQVQGR